MRLSAVGQIAEAALVGVPVHYSNVRLDEFVIMPNHIHAILVREQTSKSPIATVSGNPIPTASTSSTPGLTSLANVVGGYKSEVSRRCHAAGFAQFAWHGRFHDRILRGDRTVDAVRQYIRDNPINWIKDSEFLPPVM